MLVVARAGASREARMQAQDAADLLDGLGFPCVEWLDGRRTSSDSTPSMWALVYATTPSSSVSTGSSPSTAMIE